MNWAIDVTDVALEWAERNVKENHHVYELIEIRRVETRENVPSVEESENQRSVIIESEKALAEEKNVEGTLHSDVNKGYHGLPILLGVVRDGEKFDFCMCNPPFFETMEEAGLNPKTSCGGTPEEMVCPGGEKAFITRIIEDSVALQQTFRYCKILCTIICLWTGESDSTFTFIALTCRWYTSMVGRKSNLKFLVSKLWEVGVSIVKTTEFVQGQTCRWGLAWSFVPPIRKNVSLHVAEKSNVSFMLEEIGRAHV